MWKLGGAKQQNKLWNLWQKSKIFIERGRGSY